MRLTVVVVALNYQMRTAKVNAQGGIAMKEIAEEQLEALKFGEIQIHKHVAVRPIMNANGSVMDY